MGTERCCFAAGQLSWTISVVTGLGSPVVGSVYRKDLILRGSSRVPGLGPLGKWFPLAFSWRQVRRLLLAPCPVSFLCEAWGLSSFLAVFSFPCSSRLLMSPLRNCQDPHGLILLTGLEDAVVPLFGSVSGSTRLKPREVTGSSSPRSQPVNLHRHSAYCHLIALFTLIAPWKRTLQNKGSPPPPAPQLGRDLKRLTFKGCQEILVDTCDILVFQFHFAVFWLFVLERCFYECLQITEKIIFSVMVFFSTGT